MKILKRFEDSALNTLTSKQGYYHVGDKFYHNKVNALIEASRTKQKIGWNFNYDIYSAQAKRPRMPVTLPQLYRERALQLRDQYDYLIIAFSGGSDSDTVLKTFLNNNIKIDEVWVDWNHTMIERAGYTLNYSKDPVNMPSEWYLVIEPELRRLRAEHPEIKIRISESMNELNNAEDQYDSLRMVNGLGHVGITKRMRDISNYVESLGSGVRAAVVLGMDKVMPYAKGNEYGVVFSDGCTLLKSPGFGRGECVLEYFFWCPEFPEIVIEQGHRLWDYLLLSPEFTRTRMKAWTNGLDWRNRDKVFDSVIKQICYPEWDFSKHQVDKSTFHRCDIHAYSRKFIDERFYQGTESFLESHFSMIDQSFIDPKYTDIKELTSFFNFHPLGTMPTINHY